MEKIMNLNTKNWVETLKVGMPEYATDLVTELQLVMTNNSLTELEANSCALATALVVKNGELAFEIAMNEPLKNNDIREDIAKAVIELSVENNKRGYWISNEYKKALQGNGSLYILAILVALGNRTRIDQYTNELLVMGYTLTNLNDVEKIVSLVQAVGYCII
jgi:hypothetical protein